MAKRGAPTVLDAARALSEVCDGAKSKDKQGFNGVDAPFVASILSQAYNTTGQISAVHRLLKKYTGQLSGMGFEYEKLVVDRPGLRPGAKQAELPKPPSEPPASEPPKFRLPWTMSAEQLASHFPAGMTPRAKQLEALAKINESFRSGKRVVVLEMPTGGGKSPICLTVARAVAAMNGDTHFLTVQKALQDQYTRDFPAPLVEVLKGRSNYPCSHKSGGGSDCANAPCTAEKKGLLPECVVNGDDPGIRRLATRLQIRPEDHLCPYWKQLQLCHDNSITLFNFSSFLFQQRIGRFGRRDLMLIDEAHKIENQVMSFVSLELTEWALRVIDVEIDREITTKSQLMDFLREKEILTKIQSALGGASDEGEESIAGELDKVQSDALRELDMKLQVFMNYIEKSEWIFEVVTYTDRRGEKARKILARPLFAKDFATDLLFAKADRALVMSATILDVNLWARNLGLDPKEVGLVQTACDFPAENRPVHLEYAGNMGYKYFSLEQNPGDPTKPKFVKKVQQILGRHAGQRGLIHCQSHELAKTIFQGVDDSRLIFQDHFDSKDEMLAAHKSKPDSVLVSPGIKEGFDFKDDLARFQIIAKVPWASLADKIVKERIARDPEWYGWLTALDLVQSYGRIVRSKDDFGTTYIVDSGFEGFFSRNGKFLPQWFKDAIRKGPPREVRR